MLIASYLKRAFYPAYVEAVEKYFSRIVTEVDFDTVVVTGTSGLILGPRLAWSQGKKLLVVRKPSENSHSSSRLTGYQGERLFLVDDCVETGETVSRVLKTVYDYWDVSSRPVWAGTLFYIESRRVGRQLNRDSHAALKGSPVYECFGTICGVTGGITCWGEAVTVAGGES